MVFPVYRIHELSFQGRILHVNITPSLTDCREYFWCNPMLEYFGWFKLAAEDERVEAGFVDPYWILSSSHTVCDGWGNVLDPHLIFFWYMITNCFTCIKISQSFCHILTYEPRFSINSKSSKITKLRMKVGVEDLDLWNVLSVQNLWMWKLTWSS